MITGRAMPFTVVIEKKKKNNKQIRLQNHKRNNETKGLHAPTSQAKDPSPVKQ